jgi:hypothetical protein
MMMTRHLSLLASVTLSFGLCTLMPLMQDLQLSFTHSRDKHKDLYRRNQLETTLILFTKTHKDGSDVDVTFGFVPPFSNVKNLQQFFHVFVY